MRLLLIRHGATAYNADHRFTGHSDIPLSDLGKQQAMALGDALREKTLTSIVTSDLERAHETALPIAQSHQVIPRRDRDLRELAMGAWEGLTASELDADHQAHLARWRHDAVTAPPPGGETLEQLRIRIERALSTCRAHAQQNDTFVWVTHGVVIGVTLCLLLGMNLQRWQQFRCLNASITDVDLRGTLPVLRRFNDTCHLRELS